MAVMLKSPPKMRKSRQPRMTIEEFYALPEGTPDFEYEEGALLEVARPHPHHQKIILRLGSLLDDYVSQEEMGSIWPEVDVQITSGRGYVPDLVYLSQERMERYSEALGRIVGGPDLVVEIVSPSSASRDRVVKFNAYRSAGVVWYWLIDSESLTIEEYQLTTEGYLAAARVAAGETFEPQLFPGLQINLAGLLGIEIESEEEKEQEQA